MVILAEKVTLVPVQTELPGLAVSVMVGATVWFTVITTPAVTDCGLAHCALLVITQVILSPFASAVVVYVALLLPTGLPLLYH